jgi:hypothetical protein
MRAYQVYANKPRRYLGRLLAHDIRDAEAKAAEFWPNEMPYYIRAVKT